MRLKTYRAGTMADALAQVKKDLGKDAVILHTRAYKIGSFFGFGGRPQVEITASADVNTVGPKALRERAGRGTSGGEKVDELGLIAAAAGSGGGGRTAVRGRSAVAKAYGGGGGGEGVAVAEAPAAVPAVVPSAAAVAQAAVTHAASPMVNLQPVPDAVLREELAAIRRMVGQVLRTQPTTGPSPEMPQALLDTYMQLIEAEVAKDLADRITAAVRDELTPAEMADGAIVRTAVLRQIENLLPPTDTPLPTRPADGRPLTVALVGPTGVGKTTTVAKLAAAYKLRHGRRVGLITADTYRIAAVEQLRTYANIIGVPLKVVLTPEEMAQACAELADCDAVLIDTAGRSPSDTQRLDELSSFLAAAGPHQTHLVLSTTCCQGSMLRAVEQFGRLRPGHVIFTKLDEAASYGILFNVAQRLNARLAYLTTGQEVPDDIEPGRADRLARLILDGVAVGGVGGFSR